MNKSKIYKFNKDGDVFTGTRVEAAQYYGMSLSTLDTHCRQGKIIRISDDGQCRSDNSEIDADIVRYARRHETPEGKFRRRRRRDLLCKLAILKLESE